MSGFTYRCRIPTEFSDITEIYVSSNPGDFLIEQQSDGDALLVRCRTEEHLLVLIDCFSGAHATTASDESPAALPNQTASSCTLDCAGVPKNFDFAASHEIHSRGVSHCRSVTEMYLPDYIDRSVRNGYDFLLV